ncbi:hypothetical protein G4Y79_20800 [Phototrophicus methaneseepsis]|uniref:ASCH domain-containing protein n=1 Tax=Phototrophicus methaneseepsis TaxID=2710758 RepID=A0A7S8IE10_9CHLR|nr:hypothetical protein [Phototrophicus methaneseepsis]QPC82096.1 hypothetical protein G4Y79_20800 [Phototrophicus methaneseepsis]
MRRIIVKDAERLLTGKRAILNAVTNRDTIDRGNGWESQKTIDDREELQAVQHLGRHVSSVGEVVVVENQDFKPVCRVIIERIYRVRTTELNSDELRALGGYQNPGDIIEEEQLGDRRMWLMYVQPVATPTNTTLQ